jgi:hypothetical protein
MEMHSGENDDFWESFLRGNYSSHLTTNHYLRAKTYALASWNYRSVQGAFLLAMLHLLGMTVGGGEGPLFLLIYA